jgi:STE24 endopeptidase
MLRNFMPIASLVAWIVAGLIAAKWIVQLWLERLNRKNVLAHAGEVPDAFQPSIDQETYNKSIQYTLAKSRLTQIELTFDSLLLLVVLYSGILPWIFDLFAQTLGTPAWAMAAFLFTVGIGLSLTSLPFEWYAQFHLEEQFGFNTTTQSIWWLDRVKGFGLALLLGFPLLIFILKLLEWTGDLWWLWAWGALLVFQLLMLVLAPILILPLFNKFTPLPEGQLRERLLKLSERTGFPAKTIQIMDGSKRSRHSNAFFTGFGRFRKIVLFDTLIQQLSEPELEAVLAHEIGHYKKKHIPKRLAWSAVTLLLTFYILAFLANQPWFYEAFGFPPVHVAPAFLLFGLLSGLVTFWFSPLGNIWSRRHEYQADAYAAHTIKNPHPLIAALRKLSEKNLSNLTPHRLYSGFYYSHPTVLERESALLQAQPQS